MVKLGSSINPGFAAARASWILPRCANAAASDRWCEGEIAIGFDGAAKPRDRLVSLGQVQLGCPRATHPVVRRDIMWAEPQRLAVMALGLRRSPERGFRHADERMRAHQV